MAARAARLATGRGTGPPRRHGEVGSNSSVSDEFVGTDWRPREVTAARRFVAVHQVIGGGQQRFVCRPVIREYRGAGARSEP